MAQQIGARAGRDVDHLQRDEIAAAAQMHEGGLAAAAQPLPGRGLDGVEIDGDAFDDRDTLLLAPVQVGIDQIAQRGVVDCHSLPSFFVRSAQHNAAF